jgi:hypothetical protein
MRARPAAAAFTCGPTGSGHETNSKLQIFVTGAHSTDVQWAFFVSPNPFNLVGSLRIVDNQAGDLNSSGGDILLEDVCTTTVGDTYTLTLDPAVVPPCPLKETSITRAGPGPTAPAADPDTAAFRFETVCPTPTATPTLTPLATATPTATPGPLAVVVTVVAANLSAGNAASAPIPCGGTALVTVSATLGGAPVADGTNVILTTTTGSLAQTAGTTHGGLLTTLLTLAVNDQAASGSVSAAVSGVIGTSQSSAGFTAVACAVETLSAPPQIRPPSTGDAGLAP